MRNTAITPMKDEGPYILEWVAYHRLIGFNDFLIFTNDCSDGTDMILERLDEMGLVRHMPNPSMYTHSDRHHWQAIRYANTFPRLRRSDWIASFDVDEFICINTGNGMLEDLFNAVPDAQLITLNQLDFGCSGEKKFHDRLQIDQFDHSRDYTGSYMRNHSRRGIKTLTSRAAPMQALANHSPQIDPRRAEDTIWVNAAGKPLPPDVIRKEFKMLDEDYVSYDLAQLNHYSVRSMDSYLKQHHRGNANHPDRNADMLYWRKHNVNQIIDTRIQRHSDAVRDARDELLKDPELAQLHAASVAHHQDKIAELRKQKPYHMLFMDAFRMHQRHWPEVPIRP